MMRVLCRLSICLMALASLPFYRCEMCSATAVAIVTLSTAQSQFDPGVNNQGWWREQNCQTGSDSNDNFIVGTTGSAVTDGCGSHRNFFTFDLRPLPGPAAAATLLIPRGGSGTFNEPVETVEFFHVATDATTLNNNGPFNSAIYEDLGSGPSYGRFDVAGSGSGDAILSFALNAAAIADINSDLNGFFSIGGSLITNDGLDGLFAVSGGRVVELQVELVPEPSTMLLSLLTSAGFAASGARLTRPEAEQPTNRAH